MKTLITISTIFFSVCFIGCQKSDRDVDKTTNSSTDYATIQSIATDVFKLVHQAALSSKGITANNLADTTTLFGCDTLIVDTTTTPMKIDIQFNGTCNNRTGMINSTFSTKYDAFGSVVNVNFTNYYLNDSPVTGNISYSFTGIVNGVPTYSYTINNLHSKSINFKGNLKIEILTGETTANVTDDSYMISGTSNGVASVGNEFTVSIPSGLTLLGNCEWISSGVANVSPENKSTRILDFGSSCDNAAIVNIYDIKYEVTF